MTDAVRMGQINAPILEIEGLSVHYATGDSVAPVVNAVSLQVRAGECVGIVGESGAGKSQLFLAVMGLLTRKARVTGSARLEGRELLGASAREIDAVRGARLAMVFQDPMSSLTPHLRIGEQIAETLVHHRGLSRSAARQRALELLQHVQVSDAALRLRQYPHELSGGMRQRAMIAMALACDPVMLIADEPTTSLDVTIQAQILQLLVTLKREQGMALALVTHDLGVIAGAADRVVVMYGGRVVEQGPVATVLHTPRHPYTAALLRSMPRLDSAANTLLTSIEGQPPDPRRLPSGCAFHPRCMRADDVCRSRVPRLELSGSSRCACHHPMPGAVRQVDS